MEINRKQIVKLVKSKLKSEYKGELGEEIGYLHFNLDNVDQKIRIVSRLQFDKLLRFQGFSISLTNLEKEFTRLIPENLNKFYGKDERLVLKMNEFYNTDFTFTQEINDYNHLSACIEEVVKCIEFHEKEIFPKLLDINFLAEYVGSVPFERKAEVVVGGSFPVHLFKKIAILKWGNQKERYLEYKRGTEILIDKYAIKKPDKYMPEFKEGFDQLINHLENEPNPFDNATFANNA